MDPNLQLEMVTNAGVLTVPVNGDAGDIHNCMEVKEMIDVMRVNSHAEFIHPGVDRVDSERRRCMVSECMLVLLRPGPRVSIHDSCPERICRNLLTLESPQSQLRSTGLHLPGLGYGEHVLAPFTQITSSQPI